MLKKIALVLFFLAAASLPTKDAEAQFQITSPSTATALIGIPFSYQITANEHVLEFHAWDLPDELTIDPMTGLISGTLTAPAVHTVILEALDSFGNPVEANLTLTVRAALPPTISNLSSYSVSQNGTLTILASNNPTSFSSSTLPQGFTFNTASGTLALQSVAVGSYSITFTASNDDGSDTKTIAFDVTSATAFCHLGTGQEDLLTSNDHDYNFATLDFVEAPSYSVNHSLIHQDQTGNLSYVFCADFNKDGASDLLYVYNANYSNLVNLSFGPLLVSSMAINPPANFRYAGVGDYDGDGDQDIYFIKSVPVRKRYLHDVRVARNDNSSFTFVAAPVFALKTDDAIQSVFNMTIGGKPKLTTVSKKTSRKGVVTYDLHSFSFDPRRGQFRVSTKTFDQRKFTSRYPVTGLANLDAMPTTLEPVIAKSANLFGPNKISNISTPNSEIQIPPERTLDYFMPALPY